MEVQEKSSRIVVSLTAKLENFVGDSAYCEIEIQENVKSRWEPLGSSETIPACNEFVWQERFQVNYKFQSQQLLKFSIFQLNGNESSLFALKTIELSKVLHPTNTIGLDCGTLVLACEEVLESKKKVFMVLSGKNLADLDVFSKSDPYIIIFRRNNEIWSKIHESKVVQDNCNPEWELITMDYSHFCNCDPSTLIKVECFDYDSQKCSELIGICEFPVSEIHPNKEFIFRNPNKIEHNEAKITGYLCVNQYELVEEASFIDHLRQGMNLNLTVAIDYTSSNGIVTDVNSLHHIKEGELNEYEQAIEVFGAFLSEYDSDHKYPVFGFGGIPNWIGQVSHAFPLTKNPENPYCEGYEEILKLYRSTIHDIELHGPTHFSEIISKQIQIVNNSDKNLYHILLMLTDGDIHDYQETVDLIVAASTMPISILIIGIGYEHFLQQKALDGDKYALVDSHGKKAARDIVQFLPFRNYKQDLNLLSREALMEIPTQLMTYMKIRNSQ